MTRAQAEQICADPTNSYSIEEHNHRLAAWAAATAARESKLCRFSVRKGVTILENAGFRSDLAKPEQLPSPSEIDEVHLEWRTKVIEAAANEQLRFSHGVGAKLINCYLKVRFVCANCQDHRNVRSLHPPIDDLLLQSLAKQNVGGLKEEWARLRNARWSKFSSNTYQEVIDRIRQVLRADEPLWQIERFWIGFR
jgi:hypothetical protein